MTRAQVVLVLEREARLLRDVLRLAGGVPLSDARRIEVAEALEQAARELAAYAAQAARIAALEGALRRLEKAELAYRSAPHMLDGIEAEMGRTWAEMLAAGDAARAVLAKEAPRG